MRPSLILFAECKPCLSRAATVRERLRDRLLTRAAQYQGTHASANCSKLSSVRHAHEESNRQRTSAAKGYLARCEASRAMKAKANAAASKTIVERISVSPYPPAPQ